MLTQVLPEAVTAVAPFATALFKCCLTLLEHRQVATQLAAFKLLIDIVDHLSESLSGCKDATTIDLIATLFQKLSDNYLFGQSSKTSDTAKGQALHLLGTLAARFPGRCAKPEFLFGQIVEHFDMAMAATPQTRTVVAGALGGLMGMLDVLDGSSALDASSSRSKDSDQCEFCLAAFRCTMATLSADFVRGSNRTAAPRAALLLLQRHAQRLQNFVVRDSKNVYGRIKDVCSHNNVELRRDAYGALNSILRVLASDAVFFRMQNPDGDDGVNFFVAEMTRMSAKGSGSRRQTCVGLRGLGLFTALLKSEDVRYVSSYVVARCSDELALATEPNGTGADLIDARDIVSTYIEVLASIAPKLQYVSEDFLLLQDLAIKLTMDNLSGAHRNMQHDIVWTVVRAYVHLQSRDALADRFLSSVAYFGLQSICMQDVTPEAPERDALVRKKYRNFFTSVCQCLRDMGGADEVITLAQQATYDAIMRATLKLVSRLKIEFSSSKAENVEDTGEDGALHSIDHGVPTSPHDNQAFNVLVEFVSELLSEFPAFSFSKWALPAIRQLVQRSMEPRNYESSGLYNLLYAFVNTCCKANFFQTIEGTSDDDTHPKDNIKRDADEVLTLFRSYVYEIQERACFYQNELQASCVKLILALPPRLIKHDLDLFVPTLQMALVAGTGYTPLASVGFNALEDWLSAFSEEILAPHLKNILPCLERYLQPVSHVSESIDTDDSLNTQEVRVGPGIRKPLHSPTTSSNEFSLRAARILGRLGTYLNRALLTTHERSQKGLSWIRWTSNKILEYCVPFQEGAVKIHLDDLLPHLVQSATSAHSREVKMTSCEALHSTVTILIAESNSRLQRSKDSAGIETVKILWKHVFGALLILACDVEHVIIQLFEPLVMQVLRWVSGLNGHAGPSLQQCLLECIFEALVDNQSSRLRALAARCGAEFFDWGLKQTRNSKHIAPSLHLILRKICSLAVDPNKFKRLGAAMIFNGIYTKFRSDTELVNRYSMELLVTFVCSLKYSEGLNELDAVADEIIRAGRHLVKMIYSLPDTMKENDESRLVPTLWDRESATVTELVDWAINEAAMRTQKRFQDMCWHIIRRCAPMTIVNAKSASDGSLCNWMCMKIASMDGGFDTFVKMFDIASNESLLVNDATSLSLLSAVIHNFNIMMDFKIIGPEKLFSVPLEVTSAISTFTESMIKNPSTASSSGAKMQHVIQALAVEILTFIKHWMSIRAAQSVDHSQLFRGDKSIAEFVVASVLSPEIIGFVDVEAWQSANIPSRVQSAIGKGLTLSAGIGFRRALACYVKLAQNDFDLIAQGQRMLDKDEQHLRVRVLVDAYKVLIANGLLVELIRCIRPEYTVANYSADLIIIVSKAVQHASTRSPQTLEACKGILEIAFATHAGVDVALGILRSPRGGRFYEHYQDELDSYFVRHAQEFLPALFDHASEALILRVLHSVLRRAAKNAAIHQGSEYAHEFVSQHRQTVIAFLDKSFADQNDVLVSAAEPLFQSLHERMVAECQLMKDLLLNCTKSSNDSIIDVIQAHSAFDKIALRIKDILIADREVLALTQKVAILPALHYLIGSATVMSGIEGFCEMHLQYEPAIDDNVALQEYSSAISALLEVMIASRSSTIIKHILIIQTRGELQGKHIHPCENLFQLSFQRYGKIYDDDTLLKLLMQCMSYRSEWDPAMWAGLARRVMRPLLQSCKDTVTAVFFKKSIVDIMAVCHEQHQYPVTCTANDPSMKQVRIKTGCFELLRVMFDILPPSKVKGKTDEAVVEYAYSISHLSSSPPNNSLVKWLCGQTIEESLKGSLLYWGTSACCQSEDCSVRKVRHMAACAAFNALQALLTCIDAPMKFWEHVLLSSPNVIKAIAPWWSCAWYVRETPTEQFLRQQKPTYPCESRLLPFDLGRSLATLTQADEKCDVREHVIRLGQGMEKDLHSHACSYAMTCIVRRILDSLHGDSSSDATKALNTLTALMANVNLPKYAQALIASALYAELRDNGAANVTAVDSAHLILFLKNYMDKAHVAEMGVQSIVFGICALVTQSQVELSNVANDMLRSVTEALMHHAYCKHSRAQTHNNVALFSAWLLKCNTFCGEKLVQNYLIDYSFIFAGLSAKSVISTDSQDMGQVHTALLLLQAILAQGLPPFVKWDDGPTPQDYFILLMKLLTTEKESHIYLNSATCLGAALRYLRKELPDFASGLSQRLHSKKGPISVLSMNRKDNPFQFVAVIHRLAAAGDTMSCTKWYQSVSECLEGGLQVNTLELAYEILVMAAKTEKDIFNSIGRASFERWICSQHGSAARAALQILANGADALEAHRYEKVLALVEHSLGSHPDDSLRMMYFSYLRHVYTVLSGWDQLNPLLLKSIENSMLVAFADVCKPIRTEMLRFWNTSVLSQKHITNRLLELFERAYSPQTEAHFLHVVAHLLLDLCTNTNNTWLPALGDSYTPVSLDTSLAISNLHMSSMYAAAKTLQDGHENEITSDPGFVRQTIEESLFSQSQDSVGDALFTQANDTIETLATQGVAMDTSDDDVAMQLLQKSERRNIRLQFRLRRQHIHIRRNRDAKRMQKVKARNKTAILYRKYRDGELPDTSIKHDDILLPYRALAFCDAQFAQQLVTVLTASIVRNTDLDGINGQQRMSEAFSGFFQQSTRQPSSVFVDAICEIASLPGVNLELDAGLIRNRCKSAGVYQSGILLLEAQMGKRITLGHQGKRRRLLDEVTPASPEWQYIADLYQELGDSDAVQHIFAERIQWPTLKSQSVTSALLQEFKGNFEAANKIYKQLEESNIQDSEKDFLAISRHRCSYMLGIWDTQVDLMDASTKCDNREFQWWLHNHINAALFDESKNSIDILKSSMNSIFKTDNGQSRNFQSWFAAELALVHCASSVAHENPAGLDATRELVLQGIAAFTNIWHKLHPLMTVAKQRILNSLQPLIEIEEILDVLRCTTPAMKLDRLTTQLRLWRNRSMASNHDIIPVVQLAWARRRLLVTTVGERLASAKASTLDLVRRATSSGVQTLISRALGTKAFGSAERALRILHEHTKSCTESAIFPELRFTYRMAMVEYKLKKQQESKYSDAQRIGFVLDCLNKISDYSNTDFSEGSPESTWLSSATLSYQCRHLKLRVSSLIALADLFYRGAHSEIGNVQKELVRFGVHICNGRCTSELCGSIIQAAEAAISNFDGKSLDKVDSIRDAHDCLAQFVEKLMVNDSDFAHTARLRAQLQTTFVASTLKSMALLSRVANCNFPSALKIVSEHTDYLGADFAKLVPKVPCWRFLGWISQMIPHLDKQAYALVLPIFEMICKDYPGALVYPLMISIPQLNLPPGSKNRAFVEKCQEKVTPKILIRFVEALETLQDPDIIWKDFCESNSKDPGQITPKSIEVVKKRLGLNSTSTRRASGARIGALIQKFNRKFGSSVQNILDRVKDVKKLMRDGTQLYYKMRDDAAWKSDTKRADGIHDYSPWLAQFQGVDYNEKIEVPGQYNTESKPQPETHTTIDCVDPSVLRLASMRKPKRIRVKASNGKSIPFLVKGGEDLRQDQRIMQVFELMNQIYNADRACAERNLSLRTYQVFPITEGLGLLGWVENTSVLKSMTLPTDEDQRKSNALKKKLYKWPAGSAKDYYKQYTVITKSTEDLNSRRSMIRSELNVGTLQSQLLRLASCPQAHLSLRRKFAHSLATMSASHYILGIGDRHLSNTLIDIKSGEVVGIDFGHAFGSATVLLAIPEMVPFRLTPQLEHTFRPLGTNSWFRQGMIASLDALRRHKHALLSTMRVFVEEPLVDWAARARHECRIRGDIDKHQASDMDQDVKNFSEAQLATVALKLDLVNPVNAMIKDLQTNAQSRKDFPIEAVTKLVSGRDESKRRLIGDKCRDTAEQVDCLIEMATDEAILATFWVGWNSWI